MPRASGCRMPRWPRSIFSPPRFTATGTTPSGHDSPQTDAVVRAQALSQAYIAAPAQAEGAHALRECALNPGPHTVAFLPGGVVHPGPRRVQRLVFLPWVEVDGAACGLRRRAQRPGGAGATIGAAEHGLDAGAADLIEPRAPGHRDLAL